MLNAVFFVWLLSDNGGNAVPYWLPYQRAEDCSGD